MSQRSRHRLLVHTTDQNLARAARLLGDAEFELIFSRDYSQSVGFGEGGLDAAVIDLKDSGFSLARDLLNNSPESQPKIIMVIERDADRWLCKQAGAELVILKPLADPSVLTVPIERLFLIRSG